MRVAAIGIGSNSLRMLVADIYNKEIKQIVRDRCGLRVFAALSELDGGRISSSMIFEACESINNMKFKALDLGSNIIHLFATSATRDASNKDEFLNAIFERTGLKVDVISGDDEAKLSFFGSTMGNKAGMIDIGGGSTEIAFGMGKKIDFSHSFQMGAVRLSRKLNINNSTNIDKSIEFVKNIFAEKQDSILSVFKDYQNSNFYGVGGTLTSAGAYIRNISWSDYDKINGFKISKSDAYKCLCELSDMSLEDRTKLKSIQKNRADIIVYGMLILYSCMDFLGLDNVIVSTKGNLEGYVYTKNIYA